MLVTPQTLHESEFYRRKSVVNADAERSDYLEPEPANIGFPHRLGMRTEKGHLQTRSDRIADLKIGKFLPSKS